MGLSQALVDKFGGQLPKTFDELITLPGVGRKTANVFLNVLYRCTNNWRGYARIPAFPPLKNHNRQNSRRSGKKSDTFGAG